MRKSMIILVLLFITSFGITVNAPRQIFLFCNPEDLASVPEAALPIVERAIFSGFDSETNFTDMSSRFGCQMYLSDPMMKIEFFVLASRILGVEKDVLRNYPLMAPTFTDVKTSLEKSYVNNSYDFSRDFGYIEYIQSYMNEKFGFNLIDGSINPLDNMKKIDVIKGIVRLFSAVSKIKGLKLQRDPYKWAEELSEKLKGHPGSGVEDVKDVGYISVFERLFLVSDGKKLIPLIKLPMFAGSELKPSDPAPRWWTIALMYYIFNSDMRIVDDNNRVPVRYPNNLVVYVPKKDVDYSPVELTLKAWKNFEIAKVKENLGEYPVVLVKGKKGSVIILDNTVVEQNITYIEKSSTRNESEKMKGADFAAAFAALPDNAVYGEKACKVKITAEKLEDGLKVISLSPEGSGCSEDMLKKIPSFIKLSEIGENAQVKVNEIEVGTVSEMKRILKNAEELKKKIKSTKTIKLKDLLPHMLTDFYVVVKRKTIERDITKADYIGGTVRYIPVRDRLNMEASNTTFNSISRFVATFSSPYELVSEEDRPDFVQYWEKVYKGLKDVQAPSDAEVAGKVAINITKDISEPYKYTMKFEPLSMVIWKFFVGQIISHEPATRRIMTQKFVEPLEYFDDTWIYVKFKDGRVVKDKKLVEIPNIFYDSKGTLKKFVLWYQLVKEDGHLKIKYIIAEEY